MRGAARRGRGGAARRGPRLGHSRAEFVIDGPDLTVGVAQLVTLGIDTGPDGDRCAHTHRLRKVRFLVFAGLCGSACSSYDAYDGIFPPQF